MSKNKTSGSDLKQEDVLQAVVLADSFDFRFSPITRSAPRVLKTSILFFLCIFTLIVGSPLSPFLPHVVNI